MAYEVLETCMLVPGLKTGECSGWVQAWGSIIAIFMAFLVVQRQHQLERKRAEDDRKAARIALLAGALQLVGGVYRVFDKVHELAGRVPPVGAVGMMGMLIELRGLVGAIDRINFLQFDDHTPIEALLVAQSLARWLDLVTKESTEAERESGQTLVDRWAPLQVEAKEAMDMLKPKLDALHTMLSK